MRFAATSCAPCTASSQTMRTPATNSVTLPRRGSSSRGQGQRFWPLSTGLSCFARQMEEGSNLTRMRTVTSAFHKFTETEVKAFLKRSTSMLQLSIPLKPSTSPRPSQFLMLSLRRATIWGSGRHGCSNRTSRFSKIYATTILTGTKPALQDAYEAVTAPPVDEHTKPAEVPPNHEAVPLQGQNIPGEVATEERPSMPAKQEGVEQEDPDVEN